MNQTLNIKIVTLQVGTWKNSGKVVFVKTKTKYFEQRSNSVLNYNGSFTYCLVDEPYKVGDVIFFKRYHDVENAGLWIQTATKTDETNQFSGWGWNNERDTFKVVATDDPAFNLTLPVISRSVITNAGGEPFAIGKIEVKLVPISEKAIKYFDGKDYVVDLQVGEGVYNLKRKDDKSFLVDTYILNKDFVFAPILCFQNVYAIIHL